MSSFWTAAAGWLLHTAVGGGLLLLVVLVAGRWVRQPARRQRLSELGLAAALLLALVSLGPCWLPLPRDWARAFSPQADTPAGAPALPPPVGDQVPPGVVGRGEQGIVFLEQGPVALGPALPPPGPEKALPPAPNAVPDRAEVSWEALIPPGILIFLVVGGLLLGRWLLGHLVLRRLLREAVPPAPGVARPFLTLAGCRVGAPRLLVSRRLRVPLSCGLFRPTVLLPAALAESADGQTLHWVFVHELTHLERRDPWSCWLFGLGQAVYFYLPWFWALRRQVRLCQEYVADAAATAHEAGAADYAQFLLTLRGMPALPVGATGVLSHSSDLFRRITMLLREPIPVERRCPRRWWLGAAAVLLSLAVVAGGLGLAAEPAPDQKAEKKEEKAQKKVIIIQGLPQGGIELPRVQIMQPDLKNLQLRLQMPDLQKQLLQLRLQVPDLMKQLPQFQGADAEQIRKNIEELQKKLQAEQERLQAQIKAEQERVQALQKDLQKRLRVIILDQRGRGRLGAHLVKPGAALADQLDLPKGKGLLVESVQPDSPAARAGLKPNDILLEIGGKAVSDDPAAFLKALQEVKADAVVNVVVLRKGKKVPLKLAGMPANKPMALGVGVPAFPQAGLPFPPAGIPALPQIKGVGGIGFPGMPALPQIKMGGIGVPGMPALPQIKGGAGIFPAFPQGGGNAVMTTVVRTNDRFTTRYQEGTLIITLTGNVADGRAKIKTIHVQDGGVSKKYESVDKVPEQYRDKVKSLADMSGKNQAKIEVRP